MRKWLFRMRTRGLIHFIPKDLRDQNYRRFIEAQIRRIYDSQEIQDKIWKTIIEKDLRWVEAAIKTDRIIFSSDNEFKNCFSHIVKNSESPAEYDMVKRIGWYDPSKISDNVLIIIDHFEKNLQTGDYRNDLKLVAPET
jgi:hypothetical protein